MKFVIVYIILCKNTFSVKNGEAKLSRIIPKSECMKGLVITRSDIIMRQGLRSILNA